MLEKLTNWLTFKKAITAIVAVTLIVYLNILANGFVWDDEEQIVNNVTIQNLYNWPQVFSGATFSTGGAGLSGWFFRPFFTLTYMLNFAVWHANAGGFHFFQLVFHTINAILIFKIIETFLKEEESKFSIVISTFAALIFAVHPLLVEAVAYIASLNYVMLTFFNLLALLLIQRAAKPKKSRMLVVGFFLLAAFLFNESALVFIPILASYLLIFKNRHWKYWTITLASISAFYFFIRLVIVKNPIRHPEFSPISEASFYKRILTIPAEAFYYLKRFFFPSDLAISRHFVISSPKSVQFIIPLAIEITLLTFIIYLMVKFKSRIILFGLIFFLLGFALVSNIIPLDMTVAERWIYFPSVGLIIILSGLMHAVSNRTKVTVILLLIFSVTIALFGLRTIIRNSNWHSGLSLYSHDIKISKNSFDLENNLGVELFRKGDYEEAKVHFENSIALQPKWYFAYNNLGAVFEQEKNYQKAKELYYKTLGISDYYIAYENIAGILLFRDNNPAKAKEFSQNALKKLPQNGKLWLNLALSNYELKDYGNALQAAENAYRFFPNDQTAYVYSRLYNNQPIDLNK